jgi:hypothetical protein
MSPFDLLKLSTANFLCNGKPHGRVCHRSECLENRHGDPGWKENEAGVVECLVVNYFRCMEAIGGFHTLDFSPGEWAFIRNRQTPQNMGISILTALSLSKKTYYIHIYIKCLLCINYGNTHMDTVYTHNIFLHICPRSTDSQTHM